MVSSGSRISTAVALPVAPPPQPGPDVDVMGQRYPGFCSRTPARRECWRNEETFDAGMPAAANHFAGIGAGASRSTGTSRDGCRAGSGSRTRRS